MHLPAIRRAHGVVGALTGTLVLSLTGLALPVAAAHASTGPVSATPVRGTPELAPSGTTEQIRQLKECGGVMYAVGTFTKISQGTATYTRDNVFSFSETAPYAVTSWNPGVNGAVNTIAFDGSDCSYAYIGGRFTSVDGTRVENLAKVSTSSGAVDQSFAHGANNEVDTMAVYGSHLLTGGPFTSVNGSSRKYYVSLSLTTGRDDGYLRLNISGNYQYPTVARNHTRVYKQEISHAGRRMLVEGDFTSVGGLPRQQIFQMFLGSPTATVTSWTSTQFDAHCTNIEPFYVRDAAWSTDDNTVYIATTGAHPYGWQNTFPLTGLCDVVAAFSASEQPVSAEWVNYTGCDSLYSVIADSSAVYVAGHERWAYNQNACNQQGPGAIPAQGLGGFTASGALLENSSHTAGIYSRGRGLGADDLVLTGSGLWIASDNSHNTTECGHEFQHAGICFLPYG